MIQTREEYIQDRRKELPDYLLYGVNSMVSGIGGMTVWDYLRDRYRNAGSANYCYWFDNRRSFTGNS